MLVWLLLFTALCIAGYVTIWYLFCTYVLKDDWILLLWGNKKAFFAPLIYVLYCLVITLRAPIYDSTVCWRDGQIQKMETQYSWIMNQCQGKTNNGVFMEMKRQRGLPGGDEHDNNADSGNP